MGMTRRDFMFRGAMGTGVALLSGCKTPLISEPRLMNPCATHLPPELAGHPLVMQAWEGLNPDLVWDAHVHLAGIGDSDSGIEVSRRMMSPVFPAQYVQRLFYMNAGCVHKSDDSVDLSYVARIHNLMKYMPEGFRVMLFAFDRTYTPQGEPRPDATALYVPNQYARDVARTLTGRAEWVCSVHPYREDAIEALEWARAEGARAVKWLPPAMGIDPSSPRCADFYDALVRLRLPLITHVGEELAVVGAGRPVWGNPLKLRPALDRGVTVVMAHCASIGEDIDLDKGEDGPRVESFSLFRRLMQESHYHGILYGDISAVTQRNRPDEVMQELLEREEWQDRLLFGSDYPLPGVLPLTSPVLLARSGLLDPEAVHTITELRRYNPILFDFVLKRHLSSRGQQFGKQVFETRRVFDSVLQAAG